MNRRNAIKKLTLVAGTAVVLPAVFKPTVESVVLPAHAQTSEPPVCEDCVKINECDTYECEDE